MRLLLWIAQRPHHHLLGAHPSLLRSTTRRVHRHRRWIAPCLRHPNRQHHRLLGIQLGWTGQSARWQVHRYGHRMAALLRGACRPEHRLLGSYQNNSPAQRCAFRPMTDGKHGKLGIAAGITILRWRSPTVPERRFVPTRCRDRPTSSGSVPPPCPLR